MDKPIKVGDIIDGKIVTKVFMLSGGLAYQSEPVGEKKKEPVKAVLPLKATLEKMGVKVDEEKPKRGRRKSEK
jgi:hypothetical protein